MNFLTIDRMDTLRLHRPGKATLRLGPSGHRSAESIRRAAKLHDCTVVLREKPRTGVAVIKLLRNIGSLVKGGRYDVTSVIRHGGYTDCEFQYVVLDKYGHNVYVCSEFAEVVA